MQFLVMTMILVSTTFDYFVHQDWLPSLAKKLGIASCNAISPRRSWGGISGRSASQGRSRETRKLGA